MSSPNTSTVVEEVKYTSAVDGVEFKTFILKLNGVTIELSSYGACIAKFLVPSRHGGGHDDIVLGYNTSDEFRTTKNPSYFGCVVGRVANRIALGRLQIEQGGPTYHLDTNFGPNHLHGGSGGFSKRIWEAEAITNGVRFTIESVDGDQGYPGSLKTSAAYTLTGPNRTSVKLSLTMESILKGEKNTPVNLAQHAYFNLARHDHPMGILEHHLQLRHCSSYTPIDETGIPTREVRGVQLDTSMDFRQDRLLQVALIDYAIQHAGRTPEQALVDTRRTRIKPDLALGRNASGSEVPYGFDHNYVVEPNALGNNSNKMTEVAVLRHTPSQRRLTVFSDAPGVQLYTGNFLDGTPSQTFKDGASYAQWQGLCLETQHFPDSILVDEKMHSEFAKGSCVILSPNRPNYQHHIEYLLEFNVQDLSDNNSALNFCGNNGQGDHFLSVQEMWEYQGLYQESKARGDWYQRAADYYEENCPPTVDGMLGGYSHISDIDLAGSRKFLDEMKLIRPHIMHGTACDCGAGIGRITKGLLLQSGFQRCDLVEGSARFLDAAPEYLGDDLASKCRFFCSGLQDWQPSPQTYSVIWIQWVLCYLTDEDVIQFLKRCALALISGGVVVLKENICVDEGFVVDDSDASVIRSEAYWRTLIHKAGLRVIVDRMQDSFPDEIFRVQIMALEKGTV